MIKKLFLFVVILVACVWGISQFSNNRKPLGTVNNRNLMEISTSAFANNGVIPSTYTCNGYKFNPPLQFSGVSADTRSLALIIDDIDAPSGTYTHWVIYNMPPETTNISENAKPPGIVAKNSAGLRNYAAFCPPSGEHRYVFRLYALDGYLPNDSVVDKADLIDAMTGHILDQAQLIGRYGKN